MQVGGCARVQRKGVGSAVEESMAVQALRMHLVVFQNWLLFKGTQIPLVDANVPISVVERLQQPVGDVVVNLFPCNLVGDGDELRPPALRILRGNFTQQRFPDVGTE